MWRPGSATYAFHTVVYARGGLVDIAAAAMEVSRIFVFRVYGRERSHTYFHTRITLPHTTRTHTHAHAHAQYYKGWYYLVADRQIVNVLLRPLLCLPPTGQEYVIGDGDRHVGICASPGNWRTSLCVARNRQLCKNGWTDREAVTCVNLYKPKKPPSI